MIGIRRTLRAAAALLIAVSMTAGAALARAECSAASPSVAAEAGHDGMTHGAPSASTHNHGGQSGDHHTMPDGMRDCALSVVCTLAGLSSPRAAFEMPRTSSDGFVAVYRSPANVERAPDTPPPRA